MKKRLLFILLTLVFTACSPKVVPPENAVVVEQKDINPLNGSEGTLGERVVMWVIDNHPNARPQDGLSLADIIYEVPVEGGLTRFLAITASKDNAIIGPLRSARGYFALLAAEYKAVLVHHGASASFADEASARNIEMIDLTNPQSQPVWRDAGRVAPHNLYSNIGQVHNRLPYREYDGRLWLFKADRKEGNVKSLTLVYPGGYKVEYDYRQGRYHRADDLAFQNVIVQQTNVRDGDEVSVELLTNGIAYLFTQGQVLSGTWTKPTADSATMFLDASGKEWELTPGKTIIHIVPILTTLQFK